MSPTTSLTQCWPAPPPGESPLDNAAAGFRQASIRANSIVHRAERIVAMATKGTPEHPPIHNESGIIMKPDTNADSQQRRTIRSAHANVPDDQFDAMLARAAAG